MIFQYGPDDKVPLLKTLLIGIQWAALLISTIIILGKVVGDIHYIDQYNQVLYLRKLLFICSLTLLFQIFQGHRLPLLPGPSAVLLIGVIACKDFQISDIYTSVLIGGFIITLLAMSGFLRHIQRLFTNNVVSVVLLLIAFTIAPTILNLMIDRKSGVNPFNNMIFAISTLFIMLLLHRFLKGIWKSTLIIWVLLIGSLVYHIIFPVIVPEYITSGHSVRFDHFIMDINTRLSLNPGVFISFLFCFIALIINDLGSIQSVNELLETTDVEKRVKRGITITGFANMASGFFGVIGPVNYSISPGVIVSTGCASRYTLVPAALILLALSFLPVITGFIGSVPPVVIGSVLAYVMASQIAAGLIVAFKNVNGEGFRFENGMVIGLSIFLGTIVAFMPSAVIGSLPVYIRPILGNGFVAGVISAILLEKLLFYNKDD
jgi:xanthine/uracil permease